MQKPINDETLVAYLDGELPAEQQAHIAQHLQENASLQHRLSALKSSWDLLDDLPSPVPRGDLAQSTIEIVTLAIEQESRGWKSWWLEHRLLALALLGFVALAAGALAASLFELSQTRWRLIHLPAIVDFPALRYIDSMEFLHELSEIDSLAAAAGVNARRAIIGDGNVPADIAARQAWVENLPEDSRGRLRNHLADFEQANKPVQASVHDLTQNIYSQPDTKEHFLNTIRAYRAILEAWGEKAKLDLLSMPAEKRIAAIKARVAVELVLNHIPTAQDRQAFNDWLNSIIDKEENMEQFYLYTNTQVINDLLSGDPENSLVTQEDMNQLLTRLSPLSQKLLSNIVDETARRYHLGLWISSTNSNERTNSQKDLRDGFLTLPAQRQNELEFLPEEEVRKRLRHSSEVPPAKVPLR
jgi:hypothetical protein